MALSGRTIYNGTIESALTTNFELLNLVPGDQPYYVKTSDNQVFSNKSIAAEMPSNHKVKRSTTTDTNSTMTSKWRRVGLVSASSVRLDTIVWPGGDIVVSGEIIYKTIEFRIVL